MLNADPGAPSSDRDNSVIPALPSSSNVGLHPGIAAKVCELRIDPVVGGHWQIAAQPRLRATFSGPGWRVPVSIRSSACVSRASLYGHGLAHTTRASHRLPGGHRWHHRLLAATRQPAGDTPPPFVDADDIADVAAPALTNDGHIGDVYELTGPRLLTFAEAAAEISKAAGRQIRYIPVSLEDYVATAAEQNAPDDVIDMLS
jgi:hypothetical protein